VTLEEVRIEEGSRLVARSIELVERELPRMRVMALKRGTEELAVAPLRDTAFAAGDTILVVGSDESVKRLAEMAI
jgi:uncharacterized protein with PhoU and TrkA domain